MQKTIKVKVPLTPAYKPEIFLIDYFESAISELIQLSGKIEFKVFGQVSIFPKITAVKNNSREYYTKCNKVWTSEVCFETVV